LPAGITTIERYAFKGCTGLTAMTLPAELTLIGSNAFRDCANLEKVTTLKTTSKALGDNAFSGIKSNAILCVPNDAAVTTYKNNNDWTKYFSDVKVCK
jgi:hypothetical protein